MRDLLTIPEAAKFLGVPYPTFYARVQTGKIPKIQQGKRWVVRLADIRPSESTAEEVESTELPKYEKESLSDLRSKFQHELSSVMHQFSGISEQITRLEREADSLLAQELKLKEHIAQIDQIEEFAKGIH